MDFVEGLHKSQGYSVILVVVNMLTKFAHFVAVKHPYTTSSIAELFLDNIAKLHGLPQSIVTYGDTILVSTLERALQTLQSQSCHEYSLPSIICGQTKRVNQCLEMYLRCVVQDAPRTWKEWLSLVQLRPCLVLLKRALRWGEAGIILPNGSRRCGQRECASAMGSRPQVLAEMQLGVRDLENASVFPALCAG